MQLPVLLRKRKPDTHKGDYGYVLVVGASPGLTGAVCLSSLAALRMGAGLVTAAVPKTLNSIFETKLTEVMTLPLKDDKGFLSLDGFSDISNVLDRVDVIVLGPGASRGPSAQMLLLKIIKEVNKPLIIDADGINALAGNLDILKKRRAKNIILTPHLGEFSRISGLSIDKIKKKRKSLVKEFALRYNLTLVLKGYGSLISDGKKVIENKTGNPGMATAGSGDVLTGMIAALVAQGVGAFEATKVATYLHGLAGDLAAKDLTQNCLIACDIIDYIPKALKRSLKKT